MLLPKNTVKRLNAGILVIGGLALICVGVWFGVANFRFVQEAQRAPGEVVKIVAERGARGMKLYHPVVRFQAAGGGTDILFKAKPGLWPSPFDAGDEVEVAYDPDDPEGARIVSFWMLWFLPGISILSGLACLFAGRDTYRKIV